MHLAIKQERSSHFKGGTSLVTSRSSPPGLIITLTHNCLVNFNTNNNKCEPSTEPGTSIYCSSQTIYIWGTPESLTRSRTAIHFQLLWSVQHQNLKLVLSPPWHRRSLHSSAAMAVKPAIAGPTCAPDSLAVNITFDRARKHQPKHGTRAQAGQLALVCVNVCVWRCRCSLLSNRRASCRLLDRWRNTFNCTHLLPAWMFWAPQSASSSPHQTLSLIILNDGLVIRVFWIQFQKDKFTLI